MCKQVFVFLFSLIVFVSNSYGADMSGIDLNKAYKITDIKTGELVADVGFEPNMIQVTSVGDNTVSRFLNVIICKDECSNYMFDGSNDFLFEKINISELLRK